MDYIKRVIDLWDPMDLFPYAPGDEYHTEIEAIRKLLSETDCISEVAEGSWSIFTESFGDAFAKDQSECALIARRLFAQKNR